MNLRTKRATRYLFAFVLILANSFCNAENNQSKVTAILDTNQIRIGEQTSLIFLAEGKTGTSISFPVLPDTFNGIEVVNKGPIDTLKTSSPDSFRYSMTSQLTSFDSGFHVLPPFPFILNGKDTVYTEAALFEVRTIPVDTTKAFKDIRPVIDPPFDWRETIPYLIGFVVLAIAILVALRILRNRKRHGNEPSTKEAPSLPAHIIALQELEELERSKLWQQGAYKQYHIRLTEIVRNYIDRRFRIASMEFTTDETMNALRNIRISEETLRPLEQLLRAADMVKFAKAVPVGPENELSMKSAREFIKAMALNEESDPS